MRLNLSNFDAFWESVSHLSSYSEEYEQCASGISSLLPLLRVMFNGKILSYLYDRGKELGYDSAELKQINSDFMRQAYAESFAEGYVVGNVFGFIEALSDRLEESESDDAALITLAIQRLKDGTLDNTVSQEELDKLFGFSEEDLQDEDNGGKTCL